MNDPIVDTAWKLLGSWGVNREQFEEAAKAQRRQRERAWEEENPGDVAAGIQKAPDAIWLEGSMKQMARFWGGRCIGCRWWVPGLPDGNDQGACPRIADEETDQLVKVSGDKIVRASTGHSTTAAFGCILFAEVEDRETLRARTELAMALGLLPRMPVEEAAGVAAE